MRLTVLIVELREDAYLPVEAPEGISITDLDNFITISYPDTVVYKRLVNLFLGTFLKPGGYRVREKHLYKIVKGGAFHVVDRSAIGAAHRQIDWAYGHPADRDEEIHQLQRMIQFTLPKADSADTPEAQNENLGV